MSKLWGFMACSENLGADVDMYRRALEVEPVEAWTGCFRFDFAAMSLVQTGLFTFWFDGHGNQFGLHQSA